MTMKQRKGQWLYNSLISKESDPFIVSQKQLDSYKIRFAIKLFYLSDEEFDKIMEKIPK